MRFKQIVLLAMAALIGVAGCGRKKQDDAPDRLTIAVIPKGTTHEFWKSVHAGAIQAARELDADILWQGPMREDDRESQITVIENVINKGVDGIVLAPLDDTGLRMPVAQAKQAGIPVVIFDSGLKSNDYISYVATDNEVGGRMAGQYMGQLLGGKGKVILLRYAEGSDSTMQREKGFLSAIAEFKDIQVVSDNQFAGATMETAMRAAENMLSRFRTADGGVSVDGLFCSNESTTMGALQAMGALDLLGKFKMVGFDSSSKMIDALHKGHIHGFVVQNPVNMGYLGVKTIVSHLKGQPVEPRIDTGATLITPDNINEPAIQSLIKPDLDKWLK